MKTLIDYGILLIITTTLTINQFDSINCSQQTKSNEVGPDNPPLKEARCSRRHSKFIREYFARALLPIFHKYNLPVPEKCPFSPLHDIYHFHENNKSKIDVYNWKCEICGKHFSSELFLDKHFENKHTDSLQKHKHSVCLANYCRIFRCDVLMQPVVATSKCYEATMVNLKNRCTANLDLCVPNGIPLNVQNQFTAELRENLCSFLTCAKYNILPGYMSVGPSFLTVFLVVACLLIAVITYGVISHTDIIFDEKEMGQEPDENLPEFYSDLTNSVVTNSIMKKNSSDKLKHDENDDSNKYLRKRVNFAMDKND